MLYVALVEATALIVLVSLFSQMLRSVLRSSARREDALIDKVLHTAGMPWTPAPADRQSHPSTGRSRWNGFNGAEMSVVPKRVS